MISAVPKHRIANTTELSNIKHNCRGENPRQFFKLCVILLKGNFQ